MKSIVILSFSILLFSCHNNDGSSVLEANKIELAKKWLYNSLNEYFKKEIDMKSITSELYFERKNYAMRVDSMNELTIQDFKERYGVRHFTEFAGLGEGFLLPRENYGQIEIVKCEFKNRTEMKGYLFEVILKDLDIKEEYKRAIVVNKKLNGFEIDNVLEFKK